MVQLISFDGDTPTGGVPMWGDSSAMFGTAQSLIGLTEGFVQSIQATATSVFAPQISPQWPTVAAAPVPATATSPTLAPVVWTTPAAPAAFSAALDVSAMPGPYTGVAPTLTFGTAPAAFSGSVPSAPSLNLAFTYPTVVAPALPTAPPLLSISTVTFSPLTIPSFNVNVPTLALTAPNPFSYVEKAWYTSSELTAVQTSLVNAITSGTDTGLDIGTQTNLFNAAYEREYRAQADALAALQRDMEVLGYAFPPGAYVDARTKIFTETQNTIAGLSREIMVKQAELHLENVTKARELVVSLEGKLIDYYNQVSQRAFEAAKYAVESSVAIYNAQAEMFAKQLEGYRVQAEVYGTQIKGIMAQIEETKAQIEFEKTKAEINRTQVEAYSAQISAALAVLQVYKTEVDIIQTQANVEKTKIDAYAAQIQAFVGQVNAYTAQVEGYKAQVEAQGVIENVYKTGVDAYAAQVGAGTSIVNARVAQYHAQIEAYTAQLDGYKSALQAQVSQAQSLTAYNSSQIEAFKGQVTSLTSYNETLTKQWDAVMSEQERIAEVGVKAAEANGQLYIAARGLSLDASKTGAQVVAQLGAAALSAIHWNNSSSWSIGQATTSAKSASVSTSSSTSTSNSTAVNTNINDSSSVIEETIYSESA